MAAPPRTERAPRKLLLATDLSARCDRALDRAVSLAGGWQAGLVALHVLEQPEEFYAGELERRLPSWRRPPERARIVEEQLRHDLVQAFPGVAVVLETGDVADAIVRVASERGCDLIVTGMARDETLGRFWPGKTVDRLLGRSELPLLVVRRRVRAPYAHIVVATDLSDSSRHALHAALAFFPDRMLTVFHAYTAPLSGRAGDPTRFQEEYRKVAGEDLATWLTAAGVPATGGGGVAPLVEYGDPSHLLRQYAHDRKVDLVVLATRGRSALLNVLVGSTAREIVSSVPCDTLIVREPRATGSGAASDRARDTSG